MIGQRRNWKGVAIGDRNRAQRRATTWRKCEACGCRLKIHGEAEPKRVFAHFRVCRQLRAFKQKQFPYLIKATLEARS